MRASEEEFEVVSTAPVQGLIVLVILLLLQPAFALHVCTMSMSAASEGVRRGSLLGGDKDEARAHTNELLDSLVEAAKDREIAVDRESGASVDILTVIARARLPLVGGLGPRWLTVRGRALVEGP